MGCLVIWETQSWVPFFLCLAWESHDWQQLMKHGTIRPGFHSWCSLPVTLHCFCPWAWHITDLLTSQELYSCFSAWVDKKKKKYRKKKPQPNRRGGAAEVRPLVCVFIGPWINMAFLIQKGLAATESEYLSLPPGAGVQRQGRCW